MISLIIGILMFGCIAFSVWDIVYVNEKIKAMQREYEELERGETNELV